MTNNERLNKICDLLIKANRINTEKKTIKVYGFQYNYYTTLNGEVSLYYFNDLDIKEMICPLNSESNNHNRPGTIKDKTLYVVVHDTASAAKTAGAKSHAQYVSLGGDGTSWHYSCGDTDIYHQVPDNEVAYHAGDGTVIKETWYDTGIKATSDKPLIEIMDGYYYINGIKSKVAQPDVSYLKNDEGKIVYSSGGVKQGRVVPNQTEEKVNALNLSTKEINKFGVKCIVKEDGNYYLGPTYYNATYGYVANRLGNLYSIGIETMVNEGSNVLMTWHNCAKLCAKLLIENNLSVDDVRPHHYFSGKPCPMTMINANEWNHFISMLEIEYEILKLKDENTSIKLLNNDYLDGGLIKDNVDKKDIMYEVEVSCVDETRKLTFTTKYGKEK